MMKSIYSVALTLIASLGLSAMQFLQSPPPPPPDPNSGGIGGNNVPIDSLASILILTFLVGMAWFAYSRRKKVA